MEQKQFDISTHLVRLLFLGLIAAFLFLIVGGLASLATSFGVALLLAFLLSPIVNYFEGLGLPRWIGVLVIYLGFGLTLYWLFHFVIPAMQAEFRALASEQNLMQAELRIQGLLLQLQERLGASLPAVLKEQLSYPVLKKRALLMLHSLFPKDISFFGNLLNLFFVMPFILLILLLQGDGIYKRIMAMVPNRYFEMVLLLTDNVRFQVRRYLRGLGLQWLIFGSIFSLALWVVGIPQALPLGFLGATCNIIPYVGPALGVIPALLVAISDPALSIWGVLIAMLLTQIVDNVFTQPVVLAGSINLHPLIAILALITLQQYFGILGMLIALPLASILMASIEIIYKQMKAFGII